MSSPPSANLCPVSYCKLQSLALFPILPTKLGGYCCETKNGLDKTCSKSVDESARSTEIGHAEMNHPCDTRLLCDQTISEKSGKRPPHAREREMPSCKLTHCHSYGCRQPKHTILLFSLRFPASLTRIELQALTVAQKSKQLVLRSKNDSVL